MRTSSSFILGVLLFIPFLNYGQQVIKPNEFKIGMFGSPGRLIVNPNGGAKIPYETPLDPNGYKTSTLNVYKEDGFNIWQTNSPGIWNSKEGMINLIKLSKNNGLKMVISANNFYKPIDPNTGTGENTYDNCTTPLASNLSPAPLYARPDYNDYFDNVFSDPLYNDWIWGYHISEEGSYLHPYHIQSNCSGLNSSDYIDAEVPPSKVLAAMNHFKSLLAAKGVNNHKMEIMPANHNRSINNNTIDIELIGPNNFHAKEYITLLNKNDKRDVLFEGSYTAPPQANWYEEEYNQIQQPTGWHRLGFLKTIDYAKNYTSEIHKVINIENMPWAPRLIHTDSSFCKNGNLMWFQAYTSIIHGVSGVWFFDYDQSYSDCDRVNVLLENGITMNSIIAQVRTHSSQYPGLSTIPDVDITCNSAIMVGSDSVGGVVGLAAREIFFGLDSCFDREYFSPMYTNYVSHLAKELSYLVQKDIVSTDPSTIIYTKTDEADLNCIVPPAQNYIQPAINSAGLSLYATELCTENYGLRYTIRTNGTETYMIISNPLNLAVTDVSLDFSNVVTPIISNSTGVDVLFNNGAYPVTDPLYKVNRESNINLSSLTVGAQYPIYYTGNKQLSLSFGPYDVKILKFISTPPNHNNGWNLAWSNFGSGNIGGHVLGEDDLYYTGDFNNDEEEELLCIGKSPNPNSDWITLLKYENGDWNWLWSNYGDPNAGNGIYAYRDNLKVGDFDGDGDDDVIGIVTGTTKYVSFFEFTGNDWNLKWTNSSKHALKDYSDKIYVGNFDDNDNKIELFGVNASTGLSKMFKWNGSTTFNTSWSATSNHAINPYVSNMFSGDFDGGGKDLLLGFAGSWSVLFNYNGDWNWTWGNNGNGAIGGIPLPFLSTDRILAGNIDSDNRDEFFYIQTHENAAWAISHDLVANPSWNWSWNWSANPTSPAVPFVDDWSLASNSATGITNYFLIKVIASEPSYLLAMRKFDSYNPCNDFIVSMYEPTQSNFKISNQDLLTKEDLKSSINNSLNDKIVKIYPNPTSSIIKILANNSNINKVEVFDVRGQLIFENNYNVESNINVDISSSPNGIYFVKITNDSQFTSVQKIVLNK
ncbi:MAG: T9SS type A sorting domain-containing protein [Flavobacteriales bacterium]